MQLPFKNKFRRDTSGIDGVATALKTKKMSLPKESHSRKDERNQVCPGAQTFHKFPALCMELRLMIWEATWPGARAIEPREFGEDEENIKLRLAGPLLAILQTDLPNRGMAAGVLEDCQFPVALHVCQESQKHTLRQYRKLQHSDIPDDSLYFNPQRDVFIVNYVLGMQPEKMEEMCLAYGESLNSIETLVVPEVYWSVEYQVAEFNERFIKPLSGINTIIVAGTAESHGSWKGVYLSTTELQACAKHLKAAYLEASKKHGFATKRLAVMDHEMNEY